MSLAIVWGFFRVWQKNVTAFATYNWAICHGSKWTYNENYKKTSGHTDCIRYIRTCLVKPKPVNPDPRPFICDCPQMKEKKLFLRPLMNRPYPSWHSLSGLCKWFIQKTFISLWLHLSSFKNLLLEFWTMSNVRPIKIVF